MLVFKCLHAINRNLNHILSNILNYIHFIVDLNNGLPASRATRGPSPILGSSWQHNHQNRLFLLHVYLCCEFVYNPFLVYCRELAPGTVSLTGDRAQGDDSKHDLHYTRPFSLKYLLTISPIIHLCITSNSSLFKSKYPVSV